MDRIDLESVANYNWIKKELYEEFKQAQEWYKLGHGALDELENVIKSKL